jgi:hypothetical protein
MKTRDCSQEWGRTEKGKKSLMSKGNKMTKKYDKIDRQREMGLNKEKILQAHSSLFLPEWLSFLITRKNICKKNEDTSIFFWHF